MKVVLFCGGQGTRLREYSETIPKPMVPVGYRPILWHVMKYYAHYGHKDFILALGYKADYIKDYFIRYDEKISNDFVLSEGGRKVELLASDIDDWKITFVDTGFDANIGMRLMNVREHLEGEDVFLANYADGLTDMNLPMNIDHLVNDSDKVASLTIYKPTQSFHTIRASEDGTVTKISPITDSGIWLNTGYFVLRKEIFDFMQYGEELVIEPFQRLIKAGRLTSFRHQGFWQPMDTFKDKMKLDDMHKAGNRPWEVWQKPANVLPGPNSKELSTEGHMIK